MIYTDFRCFENLALFLPFSCNEKRQTAASQCKERNLEVIEKMTKTALYG